MNLTKNKKKQIEGIDFKKLYKVSDAVKMIKEKKPVYDLMANSKESKDRSHTKLKITNLNELPNYIQTNKEKFNQWILKN